MNKPVDLPLSRISDEENSNTSANPTFASVLDARLSRRSLLRGGVGTAAAAVFGSFGLAACGSDDDSSPAEKMLGFTAVPKSLADSLSVPVGYTATVLYALGDPLTASTPAYKNDGTDTDFENRAGDHHDGMEWFGLSGTGTPSTTAADRGLIGMNHEATTDEKLQLVLPARRRRHVDAAASGRRGRQGDRDPRRVDRRDEARTTAGKWAYVKDSAFNRRLTPLTEVEIAGPARGDALMVTRYSTNGTLTRGTLNNCGTGKTPWGTLLTGEENWAGYFTRPVGDDAARGNDKSVTALKRYGRRRGRGVAPRLGNRRLRRQVRALEHREDGHVGRWQRRLPQRDEHAWATSSRSIRTTSRSKARKRTALGRFAHESAAFSNPVAGQPLAVYRATTRATSTSTSSCQHRELGARPTPMPPIAWRSATSTWTAAGCT